MTPPSTVIGWEAASCTRRASRRGGDLVERALAEQRELVAAEPGHGVLGAYGGDEAAGQLGEQLVAGDVARGCR